LSVPPRRSAKAFALRATPPSLNLRPPSYPTTYLPTHRPYLPHLPYLPTHLAYLPTHLAYPPHQPHQP